MRRRNLLTYIGVATLTPGCAGGRVDTSAESERTPSPASPLQTTAEQNCTVSESSRFPSAAVPSELTKRSAKSVAVSIEESYAKEESEPKGWRVDGVAYINTQIQSFDDGFLIRVIVTVVAHKPMGTDTDDYEDQMFGKRGTKGWYRITDEKIERAPVSSEEEPPESGWTTVACS